MNKTRFYLLLYNFLDKVQTRNLIVLSYLICQRNIKYWLKYVHKYIFILTYTNHYKILYSYGIQICYHQYFRKLLMIINILMTMLLMLLIPNFLHSVWLYGKFVSASCQQLKQHCILVFAHFVFFSNFDRSSSWFSNWLVLNSIFNEIKRGYVFKVVKQLSI